MPRPPRFATAPRLASSALALLLAAPAVSLAADEEGAAPALPEGLQIFPADNPWNTPVDELPVHPNSKAYLKSVGPETPLHPDFGSEYDATPIGIPYIVVDDDQEKVDVTFEYADESDPGPYPIPAGAPIEGGPESDGDRHVIVVDGANKKLYELFRAFPNEDGSWKAGSGAVFDLTSNTLRKKGWTSADAAGLPIFPGLVRYDEVETGEIAHALRFTVQKTRKAYIEPATHYASDASDKNLPPMGLRLRLKADFDTSDYPPDVQVILEALKKYGMILADNGSDLFVSGTHDMRWDDDSLHALKRVKCGDFEVVDTGRASDEPRKKPAKR